MGSGGGGDKRQQLLKAFRRSSLSFLALSMLVCLILTYDDKLVPPSSLPPVLPEISVASR